MFFQILEFKSRDKIDMKQVSEAQNPHNPKKVCFKITKKIKRSRYIQFAYKKNEAEIDQPRYFS